MPGPFTGLNPSTAVDGLKRVGHAIYDWGTGASEPQPPHQEPSISADPTNPVVKWLGDKANEWGLNPSDFTNPNTQPGLRALGAVRDMATKVTSSPAVQALQAVTMFKTPGGEIDIPSRVAATNRFRESGWKLPGQFPEATEEFATKYPRVAAHIDPQSVGPFPSPVGVKGATSAYTTTPRGPVTEPVPVSITPSGARLGTTNPARDALASTNNARHLVYHEGTHVAQALGNTNFKDLYNAASRVEGYRDNPFEVMARRAGNRASGTPIPSHLRVPYDNAIDGLRQSVDRVEAQPLDYDALQELSAGDIKNMLKTRRMKPTRTETLQPTLDEQ